MQLRAFFVSCSLLFVLAVSAQAQPTPDTADVAFEVQRAEDVVVTGSRVASPIQETGRRVAVYTQQDIENLSVNSVDQLLDVVGGLDLQSRGGFGVQSDLKMRGSSFNGVLLLLDGARVNDPYTGHFAMDLPVPVSEIARVEVLHGPATALYGPDAFGGVVHLITKTALRSGQMGDTGLNVEAGGAYGGNNFYDAGGAARHVDENTAVSGAVSFQGSDGQMVRGDNGQSLSYQNREGPVQTDFQRRTATAALAQNVGDATLYTRAGVDDREFGAYQFYTNFDSDRAREATSTFWVQSRLSSSNETDTPWQVQVFGKQHRDRYTFDTAPDTPDRRHISRRLRVQGQASHTLGAVQVTGGASAGIRGLDSSRDGLHSDPSGGTFLSLRWTVTPRFTINQSTRVDYDPTFGVEPTPQLYASYDLDPVTLRAGGGRVVRAPTYVERFISSFTNKGSADLDAETGWSGEVGADVQLSSGFSLRVTGFGRTTRNAIDYLKKPRSGSAPGFFKARNLNRAQVVGLETEASLKRTVNGVGIRLDAAYTLLDATLDGEKPVDRYKYGINSARHHMQGSASATVGGVTVGLQGAWKDRIQAPGLATDQYGVVHTRLAYNTRLGGQRVTVSGEVRNLFDREYSEVFNAPMPQRTFLVGASVQL
ncbi:MAG: TonB-dependent receptor [Bacteroidetes bacterium SW_9_63_38]|nr:MAG: TonB-dependent receptor [Bacteroidetes bacterium SW_9_63_38]